MIINFSVQNFGTIKDKVTLSFEATNSKELEDYYIIEPIPNLRLLKLALIYGPNGSGKSTLLKALDFLRNLVRKPLSKKTQWFRFKPFLFDTFSPDENTFFSLEFIQNKIKYLYEIEMNKQAIVAEKLYFYHPNKALVFERKTDLEKQLSSIQFGSKIKFNKDYKSTLEANTLWNNTVLGGYSKTNFESKELQEVLDWFLMLKELIKPNTNLLSYISKKIENNEINKNDLVKILQKADFNISDILIEKEELELEGEQLDLFGKISVINDNPITLSKNKLQAKKISFKHELLNNKDTKTFLLPYNEESDGTQRYYQLSGLLVLMIQQTSIFSIDEIESSLHADLLKHFLLTFLVNAKNTQLIATTHHRELLIEKDIFRNDAIWFTEKKTDASIELYALSDFDTSTIRDTSSIYNAYKIGKLGAVPNIGDNFLALSDGKN